MQYLDIAHGLLIKYLVRSNLNTFIKGTFMRYHATGTTSSGNVELISGAEKTMLEAGLGKINV